MDSRKDEILEKMSNIMTRISYLFLFLESIREEIDKEILLLLLSSCPKGRTPSRAQVLLQDFSFFYKIPVFNYKH